MNKCHVDIWLLCLLVFAHFGIVQSNMLAASQTVALKEIDLIHSSYRRALDSLRQHPDVSFETRFVQVTENLVQTLRSLCVDTLQCRESELPNLEDEPDFIPIAVYDDPLQTPQAQALTTRQHASARDMHLFLIFIERSVRHMTSALDVFTVCETLLVASQNYALASRPPMYFPDNMFPAGGQQCLSRIGRCVVPVQNQAVSRAAAPDSGDVRVLAAAKSEALNQIDNIRATYRTIIDATKRHNYSFKNFNPATEALVQALDTFCASVIGYGEFNTNNLQYEPGFVPIETYPDPHFTNTASAALSSSLLQNARDLHLLLIFMKRRVERMNSVNDALVVCDFLRSCSETYSAAIARGLSQARG